MGFEINAKLRLDKLLHEMWLMKMSREPVEGVQPDIFRWARQTIGLSVADVAQALKRPIDEIKAWESGQSAPIYSQLEKLAYQVYKRPLAVFFLPAPPDESPP